MNPGRNATSLFSVLALAAAAGGCFSLQTVGEGAKDQSLGSVEAGSPTLGPVKFDSGVCLAGARQYFLGADFLDPTRALALRIVWDPLGAPAVRLFDRSDPSEKSLVFRKPECRQFKASLETTGWRINEVDDFRISADVDCGDPEHGFVKAHVSAPHCH